MCVCVAVDIQQARGKESALCARIELATAYKQPGLLRPEKGDGKEERSLAFKRAFSSLQH